MNIGSKKTITIEIYHMSWTFY